MTATPRRFLIVGSGSIGRRHARNLLALSQREVRFVDPDADALALAQRELNLPGERSLEAGLAWNPDVVLVANPTSMHLDTALAAARHGAHLFIEKPLADTLDGAQALLDELRTRRLVSLVGCNMRFHPGPRLVREALTAGRIGAPLGARFEVGSFLPSWRPGTDYTQSYSARADQGGGCVLDMIHELDLACWCFGFPDAVLAATASGKSLGIDAEALAEVVLTYDSGLVVSVHMDYVQRWRQRRCEIIGERGTVSWESRRSEVMRWDAEAGRAEWLGYDAAYDLNTMYLDELRHFLRCLDGEETACADAAWASRVTRVALAAKESAEQGRAIAFGWEPAEAAR